MCSLIHLQATKGYVRAFKISFHCGLNPAILREQIHENASSTIARNISKLLQYRKSNLKAQLLKSCWTSRVSKKSSAGTKHKTLLQRKQLTPIRDKHIPVTCNQSATFRFNYEHIN